MAKQTEEEILKFTVDQGDALNELERMKKLILQTKQEQKDLNDAYKKGSITIDELVKESVRLEGNLKRQQSTYNQVQKSVTGVKTSLDKLIDSNQKISKDLAKTSKSFEEVASQINIAGVNVGGLTSKFASFANPATAAVGIVTALGAAYARSTTGAKDLEFAQNQLSFATTILTNDFANLLSSAEDGQGVLSKIFGGLLNQLSPTTAALSRLAAFNEEKLQDLGRTEIEVRDKVNQRLEENQELLTSIQSEQTAYNDKISNADLIITNIRRNEDELKAVLEDELKVLQQQLAIDKDNEAVQTAVLQKKTEISKVERDAEKRAQAMVRLQDNLRDAEAKRLRTIKENLSFGRSLAQGGERATLGDLKLKQTGIKKTQSSDLAPDTLGVLDADKLNKSIAEGLKESAKSIEDSNKKISDSYKKRAEAATISAENEKKQIAAITQALGDAASIFGQQTEAFKILESTQTLVSTYSAAQKQFEALSEFPPLAYAAAAAAVLAGLGRVAQINAAAGGGDFYTKGPTMLLVGDNPGGVERVSVEPISGKGKTVVHPNSNLIAMAGGGTLTTNNPGGLISNSLTEGTRQSFTMASVLRSLPPMEVSVKEITKVQKRIAVKESVTKIRTNAAKS